MITTERSVDQASSYLLFHRVDSDRESRVVPFHLWFVSIHGDDLRPLVGRADTNHSQYDHEQEESHAHHHDQRYSHICKITRINIKSDADISQQGNLQTVPFVCTADAAGKQQSFVSKFLSIAGNWTHTKIKTNGK